jgi:hypothetical protein
MNALHGAACRPRHLTSRSRNLRYCGPMKSSIELSCGDAGNAPINSDALAFASLHEGVSCTLETSGS